MKAIALISGGLDSTLAAKVVADLGVGVTGVFFRTPFCAREKRTEEALLALANDLSRQAGIALRVESLAEEFLEKVVLHPRHGYGSNVNACIDCRILMLQKAREMMRAEGASFLVTGEVVAQRAMSQHRRTMMMIEREAGVEGLVLRPLSAKLLEKTVPEKNGWIDGSRLYGFNGRSRKPQIDLAVMLGIIDFPNAAGGCLLTDPRFADRMKDLMAHGSLDMDNVELLKQGRHFRLSGRAKLVVGRDARENAVLEALARPGDTVITPPADIGGPTCLLRGEPEGPALELAARIACRYSDRGGSESLPMTSRLLPGGEEKRIMAVPATEADLDGARI